MTLLREFLQTDNYTLRHKIVFCVAYKKFIKALDKREIA